MESFSKTLETHTGSYLARRRRKRAIVAAIAVAVVATVAVGLALLARSGILAPLAGAGAVSKGKVAADWQERKWDDVRSECLVSLASKPLDPFFLTYRGLASFYKGMDLPEGEDRAALVDETVASLRKALASGGRVPKAEIEYVLGKAYYDKGDSYYDESVKYLEMSLAAGYQGADSREYLALAYEALGDKDQAIRNFEAALSKSRADLLLVSAAKAYVDGDQAVKAEALLLELIASGKDDLAKEDGRFLLGEIYKARGDLAKAEDQYSQILDKDPSSAEAHYRMGLAYQAGGDPIKARAEWRKAVSLDPMHGAARQKLSEKL
jgi:tetratricopeptide (TPR) repeat protein